MMRPLKFILKFIFVTSTLAFIAGVAALYFEKQNQTASRVYNELRPNLIQGGGQQCLSAMSTADIEFVSLGDVRDKNCLIKNAIRIKTLPNTKLSSPLTLNCRTASKLINWLDEIEAKRIDHMGTYNCRKMRGSPIMSEHSFGTAIDIARINEASIKKHWDNGGVEGNYLHRAAKSAYIHFSNVITPDDNALHHDHFHLDHGYSAPYLPKFIHTIMGGIFRYL
jgi:hypothetical protein